MGHTLLYIFSAIIVVLILVILIITILKRKQKRYYQDIYDNLEREKNLIGSTPVLLELSKLEPIIKNEKMEEKYQKWEERFDTIKNEDIPKIDDMLIELDTLIDKKEYKTAKFRIAKCEMEVYKVREQADDLLDQIKEITLSEEKYRSIISKLKTKYRALNKEYNEHKNLYEEMAEAIELQLENIEKRFLEFEKAMDDNMYSDVVHIVKALDTMIEHMEIVVSEVPDLMLMCKQLIPKRIKEIEDTSKDMVEKGYPIEYLNLDYNLEESRKNVGVILDRIKVLNLEDCMFELKTFLDYLDNLFNDFDLEKRSKKVFDEVARSFKIKLQKVNNIVTDIYNQLDDIKGMYDLTDDDLNDLESVNNDLYKTNSQFNAIIGDLKNKKMAYSKLKNRIIKLSNGFGVIEENLNNCLKSLGSMHDDEMRAREQLDEITDLLKKCRVRIRKNPLPIISNDYFVQLSEANDAIYEIVKELEKTPITIKTLNIRVDTARDLSLKLYSTTNEMIKTARLSEMTIMYGNRYKPVDKDIEKGLDVAGQLFFKGNYKRSLETAIAAINIIEPDIYKKMLNLYKDE